MCSRCHQVLIYVVCNYEHKIMLQRGNHAVNTNEVAPC